MALLWIDGFEGYGTTTGSAPSPTGVMSRRYPITEREEMIRIQAGRFSGYCIRFAANQCKLRTPPLTTNDTLIVGVAFKRNSTRGSRILSMYDGTTLGMNLQVQDYGSELLLYRGNTHIVTTSGANIGVDQWYYIELKVKCHDSTGEYEIKIDGVTYESDTGVNTKAGSNNYHDAVQFEPYAYSSWYWDDYYICDGSGSNNNDFLGNQRVVAIYPGGGDVTAGFGTVVPAGSHYEAIDEEECDDDSSYVEDADVGDKDIWNYGSVPANLSQIQGLQINTMCRETDATDFDLITIIRSGGTEYDDAGQAAGAGDYVDLRRIAETDPDTGSLWTESGINNASFGVKVG